MLLLVSLLLVSPTLNRLNQLQLVIFHFWLQLNEAVQSPDSEDEMLCRFTMYRQSNAVDVG